MATLKVLKDGLEKEYNITTEQAKMLQQFKEDARYSDDVEINGVKKGEIIGIVLDEKPDVPFYYTVRLSFNDEGQNITITKAELPMIMWAFTKDTKAVCNGGAFRGKDIISIMPDYNKVLGYNKGYELEPEDFRIIGNDPTCFKARDYLNSIKQLCLTSTTYKEVADRTKNLLLN